MPKIVKQKIVKRSSFVDAFGTANDHGVLYRGDYSPYDLIIDLKPDLLTLNLSLPPGVHRDFDEMNVSFGGALLSYIFRVGARERFDDEFDEDFDETATHMKLADLFKTGGAIDFKVEPLLDAVKIEIAAAGVDLQAAGTRELVNLVRAIFHQPGWWNCAGDDDEIAAG